jgi:hypothetical protein
LIRVKGNPLLCNIFWIITKKLKTGRGSTLENLMHNNKENKNVYKNSSLWNTDAITT